MIHSSLIIIDHMLRNILVLRDNIYDLKIKRLGLTQKMDRLDIEIELLRDVTNEWWSVYPPWG